MAEHARLAQPTQHTAAARSRRTHQVEQVEQADEAARETSRHPRRDFDSLDRAARLGHRLSDVPVQRAPEDTHDRLPPTLRARVTERAGVSLDDVKVHFNSPAPAARGALAFTQGTEIHVGPGQEEHLPHEAWHVVQQKRGRVTATPSGAGVVHDRALEGEAHRMGADLGHGLHIPVARSAPPAIEASAVSSAPIQCITNEELQEGRRNLKKADFGVVNPKLRGIRTRRGADQSAADYYDHLLDTRRSMNRLQTGPTAEIMLNDINKRTGDLNQGKVHDEIHSPHTAVDIEAPTQEQHARGMGMSARPRGDTLEDLQKAFRYDGKPGKGQASRVTYDHKKASANRFNSLGHEMVHGWRNAHGLGVSPPEVSPQRNHPLLDNPEDPTGVVKGAVNLHATLKEEFETVGLEDTPHVDWAPSENAIRQEHDLPRRNDYSGARPGHLDNTIEQLDDKTDDRGLIDKWKGKKSPLQGLLKHLED